jgi:hypothetical protein
LAWKPAGAKGRPSQVHRLVAGRSEQRSPRIDRGSRPTSHVADLAGNINDMTTAGTLIDAAAGRIDGLIADIGYDTNAIRAAVNFSTEMRLSPFESVNN